MRYWLEISSRKSNFGEIKSEFWRNTFRCCENEFKKKESEFNFTLVRQHFEIRQKILRFENFKIRSQCLERNSWNVWDNESNSWMRALWTTDLSLTNRKTSTILFSGNPSHFSIWHRLHKNCIFFLRFELLRFDFKLFFVLFLNLKIGHFKFDVFKCKLYL